MEISIPSLHGAAHEATNPLAPLTSTKQTLQLAKEQAPSFQVQREGML